MTYFKLALTLIKIVNFLIEYGKKQKYINEGELRALDKLRSAQDARVQAAIDARDDVISGRVPVDEDNDPNRRED